MDYNHHQRIRTKLFEVLAVLNFDQFWRKHAPKGATPITSESFEKLSPLQFRLICYFLFGKLDREQCVRRFRNVFPARDVRQEAEFRRIAIDWMNQLAASGRQHFMTLFTVQKIAPIHYQRLSGPVFLQQLLGVAVLALQKCTGGLTTATPPVALADAERYLATRQQHQQRWRAELAEYQDKVAGACSHYRAENQRLEDQLLELAPYGDTARCEIAVDALVDRIQCLDQRLCDWLRDGGCPKPTDTAAGSESELAAAAPSLLSHLERLAIAMPTAENAGELLHALKHCQRLRMAEVQLADKVAQTERQLADGELHMAQLRQKLLASPYALQCVAEAHDQLRLLFQLKLSIFSP